MRVGFLGPEGTFTHQALLAGVAEVAGQAVEPVGLASNHDVVVAVQRGDVDHGVVPLENGREGAVSAVLDALTFDAPDVVIVADQVLAIHHCLIAASPLALDDVEQVASHPQALAQCAGWLREHVPAARLVAASSTGRAVEDLGPSQAAIAPRTAAERRGATVLAEGIEDDPGNATRFVWLARGGTAAMGRGRRSSVVFSGAGDGTPGWLVTCLSAFADRGVNLTRIESRPLRSQLGHYLFHVDLDGDAAAAPVGEAVAALRTHCDAVRVLGSYGRVG